jgi:tRNA(adenine34) deaminase
MSMEPPDFPKLHPSLLGAHDDNFFMHFAYNQAVEAYRQDEVPVGAVIVLEGEIIASAHNEVNRTLDPTAHAEILAITQATSHIGDWRLNDCTLYVTKEPCPMCAGAMIMGRMGTVVFAVPDPKMGYMGGAADVNATPTNNHKCVVRPGALHDPCKSILQTFFAKKRVEKA